MSDTLIKDMLDNAVHIGYKRQYWSPKMRDYIFGIQNGIHVFDLFKTAKKLEEVKEIVEKLSANGKEILFVGTKIQARDLVKTLAIETNHHFVINKWVPGLLTNFATLKKRIATYVKLEKELENGTLDLLTKKEKSVKVKELEKLRQAYEGLKELKKAPDAIFVVDGHYEGLALQEAKKLGVPSYGLLGSTGDIDMTTNFIPCNINSIKAIKFVLDYLKPVLSRKKVERPFSNNNSNEFKKFTPKNPNPIKKETTTEEK